MILVLGSQGNMGKRYSTILKSLGYDVIGADIKDNLYDWIGYARDATGILIATPTETHWGLLENLYSYNIRTPVLCEKPLTKHLGQLKEICTKFTKRIPLTMVMQYHFRKRKLDRHFHIDDDNKYDTYYNYYRHGNDGLRWDCIQMIALSEGKGIVKEDSPIWSCTINGDKVDVEDMDHMYIRMIKSWINKPGVNPINLHKAHLKVLEVDEYDGYINWDSSKINL